MKRILWAAALAVPALALTPGHSRALGINPNCAHGYGWLEAKALNKFAWIHFSGRLYNYGPYCGGVGYVDRNYPFFGYHHGYVPAYPGSYTQGYGGGYYGYGPVNGYTAPGAPAATRPTAPVNQPSGVPERLPTPVAPPAPATYYPTTPTPSYYPAYLGQVWPGVQR